MGSGAEVTGAGVGAAQASAAHAARTPATAGTKAAPRTHADGRDVTTGPSHPSQLLLVPPDLGPRFTASNQARGALCSKHLSQGSLEASRPPALTNCSIAYVISTGPAGPQLNRITDWMRQLRMLLAGSPDTELRLMVTTH